MPSPLRLLATELAHLALEELNVHRTHQENRLSTLQHLSKVRLDRLEIQWQKGKWNISDTLKTGREPPEIEDLKHFFSTSIVQDKGNFETLKQLSSLKCNIILHSRNGETEKASVTYRRHMKQYHPSTSNQWYVIGIIMLLVMGLVFLFYMYNPSPPEYDYNQSHYSSYKHQQRQQNWHTRQPTEPPKQDKPNDSNSLYERLQPIWRRMDQATRRQSESEFNRFSQLLELTLADTWETMVYKFRKCQKVIHPDKNSKDIEDSTFANSYYQYLRKHL